MLSSGAEGMRGALVFGEPGSLALIFGDGGSVDAASMSATPAAIMRATNSSESMVKELLLMVSMKDAAEYCTTKGTQSEQLVLSPTQKTEGLAVAQPVLLCILVLVVDQNTATSCSQSLTSCVKKYADSDTILLCILKRWMYSRLEASWGGLAWMTTYMSTGRKSSAPAGTPLCFQSLL